jgi:hypothetical protein
VLLAGRDVWNAAKEAGWRRVVPELWRKLRPSDGPARSGPSDKAG